MTSLSAQNFQTRHDILIQRGTLDREGGSNSTMHVKIESSFFRAVARFVTYRTAPSALNLGHHFENMRVQGDFFVPHYHF